MTNMINILYDDKFIAVAVKPSGLLSEGADGSFPALLLEELRQRRGASSPKEIFAVHRLDRETEGIMVYALDSSSAADLSEQIRIGEWSKIYHAVLCSAPSDDSGKLCDLLYFDRARGRSYTVDRMRKGVKDAELDYTVITRSSTTQRCLVKIKLATGRTHQIRVQFASRRMPLCGDRRYGAPAESGKRLALAATELSFNHPKTKEKMCFKTDIPTAFFELLS